VKRAARLRRKKRLKERVAAARKPKSAAK
jgi:hypothetical protein